MVASPSTDALREADHFVGELDRLGIPLRLVVMNRVPPDFGAESSEAELKMAEHATGDVAVMHRLLAEMCADAERAEDRLRAFDARTRSSFPGVAVARASEMPTDIHDMAAIEALVDELVASSNPQ